jgi:hypothetical protein
VKGIQVERARDLFDDAVLKSVQTRMKLARILLRIAAQRCGKPVDVWVLSFLCRLIGVLVPAVWHHLPRAWTAGVDPHSIPVWDIFPSLFKIDKHHHGAMKEVVKGDGS